jgi:hypothetical protein
METDHVSASNIDKKKDQDKQILPRELESFSFDDRNSLICGSKTDPSSMELLEVAQKIVFMDPITGEITYSCNLETLHVHNLRLLATKFGIKNQGSRTKFSIQFALAEKKLHHKRCNIDILASSNGKPSNNTKNIVCVINCVFHPEHFDSFLCINDRKDCQDFEFGSVNDVTNFGLDKFYSIDDNEEYNHYIVRAEYSAGHLPIQCSIQTGSTCKTIIESVIKIRGTILNNMNKSGQNSNDPYLYASVAIKKHNLVRSVSPFAAYYFFMCCLDHPQIDPVLMRYLPSSVKADSETYVVTDLSTSNKKVKTSNSEDFALMMENLNNFQSNFEEQGEIKRKHYNSIEKKSTFKLYLDLQKEIKANPFMGNDPYVMKELLKLKEELAENVVDNEELVSTPKDNEKIVSTPLENNV